MRPALPRASHSRGADVTVVGGGPAGAVTAALLARSGVRVVLVVHDGGLPLLGEILPPAARLVFRRLKLEDVLEHPAHRESPGVVSIWGSDRSNVTDHLFSPYGNGLRLDRAVFDRQLRDCAVAAGVRLVPGRHDAWRTCVSGGDSSGSLRSVLVVDATGRRAVVARATGSRATRRDSLVAVVGMLGAASSSDADMRTYVSSVHDGWWYAALLPDGRRVAAFLTDRELLTPDVRLDPGTWHRRLLEVPGIAPLVRAAGSGPPAGLGVVAADSRRLSAPRLPGHALAVGDAAMAFDPVSSMGILSAVESAAEAVPVVVAMLGEDRAALDRALAQQAEQQDSRWSRYLTRLATAYADERRWAASPFWSLRHSRGGTILGH